MDLYLIGIGIGSLSEAFSEIQRGGISEPKKHCGWLVGIRWIIGSNVMAEMRGSSGAS